jgi:hypothetical protein
MTGWTPVREGLADPPQWSPVGSVRGPQGPPGDAWEVLPYTMSGVLTVREGTAPFPISGGTFAVESVAAMVGGVPVGSPIIADVRVNGASIYTDPAARPTIPSGTRVATVGAHPERTVTAGDYFTVDVVQVGLGVPGADLTAVVRLRRLP